MAQAPTQERLKELLHYDPETGVFTWRNTGRGRSNANGVAGTTNAKGYRYICVDSSTHRAHRLAYLYVHGEMPDGLLDHKDQDPGNNRIANLRPATKSQNGLNRGPQTNNISGHTGVHWDKGSQKWKAYIYIDGKHRHLGLFTNILDAVAARKEAEIALGVSEFCPQ